jgi:transcription-repair coupling factor (superfamily II helicase)
VVTDGLKSQETAFQDLQTWLRDGQIENSRQGPLAKEEWPCSKSADEVPLVHAASHVPFPLFYPAWENLPHEGKLPHADIISERLETLVALSGPGRDEGGPGALIVTNVLALLQRTFSPQVIRHRTRALARGERLDPLDLIEWLEDQGYEAEAKVTQKGEIAGRGGILDVYPLSSPWPVRLEFFGNELESLRYFDPQTQISKNEIDRVLLPPGGELGLLRKWLIPKPDPGSPRTDNCGASTFLDHLPPQTIFLMCEPDSLAEQARLYAEQVPPGDPFFVAWEEVLDQLAAKGMTRLQLSEAPVQVAALDRPVSSLQTEQAAACPDVAGPANESPNSSPTPVQDAELCQADGLAVSALGGDLGFASLDAFRPLASRVSDPQVAEAQRREFLIQLHRWLRQGHAVCVFCNNEGERQRFGEIWREYGLDGAGESASDSAAAAPSRPAQPWLALGSLTCGFIHQAGRVVIVTDAEIFGRYKVQRARRLKSPHALAMRSALDIDFSELEEGDYVVHLQYGIGRYLGLKVLPPSIGRRKCAAAEALPESGQECLVIEYAPSGPDQPPPKLYVPVNEAHLVSKYIGAGKARPPLNTLGGTRWLKAKAQAEHAVRDLAGELLSIQATRASRPGYACAADTPWQREFEASFLYEETPDQLRAIQETKADLESPRPMDRLICGDVGFGKTEVALRAAFKAVMDGKQVAVLVPTTVLAQQHFNTFRERMADYPVRIELLSRFRSRREQHQVLQGLATGAVDIVIGTHRLLQDDIGFKDLGLVVIDEEQRFGVLHKEKFKQLRQLVDVLTLSATPIPRTLYLALMGARDMSSIETPPQDRLPVETIVTAYDERIIRDAIQRELNRQGQVFFLHNRVATIETITGRLQMLAPQARIVVGHGQMDSGQLEEVMTRFVDGRADVLLSTSIIESGLDIPNANTIIIDRADRFGLSDLYQLRGRVGRYKHQAYAYLLLPRHAGLLSDARKRISAIKQYSSLGSGFKIAMRDLEIRGAGNLLGPEQSGHITAVGFDLYCQLLKQSVSALKGQPVKPRVVVQVRLDFLALSPAEEISQSDSPSTINHQPSPINHQPSPINHQPPTIPIHAPREALTLGSDQENPDSLSAVCHPPSAIVKDPAYIPVSYIADSRQRIEIYRKLAQVTDEPGLAQLKAELRDRFGPLPAAMELLLQVTELKLVASARAITSIESKGDKLMLTRNSDFITPGGIFPRLTRKTAKGRLNEIKKLLASL